MDAMGGLQAVRRRIVKDTGVYKKMQEMGNGHLSKILTIKEMHWVGKQQREIL